MKDFYYLGIITKPFGYKGYAFVYLDTDQPENYNSLQSVFVKIDGELLPYMIEDFQYRGSNQAVVKFEGVEGDEIKDLLKMELYLPLSMLPPLTGNNFYYHEVIGFEVIDQQKGSIGKVADFLDVAQTSIMQVDCDGKEVLIPAVDELFIKLDRENKTIYIDAPEGLIDIYLHGA